MTGNSVVDPDPAFKVNVDADLDTGTDLDIWTRIQGFDDQK